MHLLVEKRAEDRVARSLYVMPLLYHYTLFDHKGLEQANVQ